MHDSQNAASDIDAAENAEDSAHALPTFLTAEWIKENLNLTPKDRREISQELARREEAWPAGKLDEDAFAAAYLERTRHNLVFPGNVEFLIARKYPAKSHRKGVSGSIRTRVLQTLEPEYFDLVQHGSDHCGVRQALYEQGELDLLAELLWIHVCEALETENAGAWIEEIDHLWDILGGFWETLCAAIELYRTDLEEEANNSADASDDEGSVKAWHAGLQEIADLAGSSAPTTPDPAHARRLLEAAQRLVGTADVHDEQARARDAEAARERADAIIERLDAIVAALPRRKRVTDLADALQTARTRLTETAGIDVETTDALDHALDRLEDFVDEILAAAKEVAEAARAYADEDAVDDDVEQRLDNARANQRAVEARVPDHTEALLALVPEAGAPTMPAAKAEPGATPTQDPGNESQTPTETPAQAQPDDNLKPAADTPSAGHHAGGTEAAPTDSKALEEVPPDDAADIPTAPAQSANPADSAHAHHSPPQTPEPARDPANEPAAQDEAPAPHPNADAAVETAVPDGLRTLTERGEFSMAYHLATCADHLGIAVDRMPLPTTLELFNTGRTVRGSGGQAALACWPLAQRLSEDLADVDTDTERGIASVAFTFAGSLRPALFAPESGARQLLEELPIGAELQFLHPVREAINELDRRGFYTTAGRLRGASDTEPARAARDAALEDLATWIDQTRQSNIVYAPATKVWRTLVGPDGRIGRVVEAIRAGASNARSGASELVRELSDTETVERLIQETDDTLRPEIARKRIEARAMDKLLINAETAATKLNDWLEAAASLDDAANAGEDRAHHEHLLQAIQSAQEEAAELARSGSPIAAAAAAGLLRVFGAFDALVNGQDDHAPITHQFALHADLLKLPGLRYVGGWIPTPYEPDTLLDGITRAAEASPIDWLQAFHDRLEEANHLATARLIEIIRRLPDRPEAPEVLAREREQAIAEARARLHQRRDQVRRDLDRAMRLDQSEDMQLSDLIDRIDAVDPDALPQEERLRDDEEQTGDPIADFPAAFRLLDGAGSTINRTAEGARQEYVARIQALEKQGGDPADQAPRLRALLDQGDLLTLAEYLETAEQGSPLPEVDAQDDAFQAFFPDFVGALDAEAPSFAELQKAARAGRDVGSVAFAQLNKDRQDDAAQIIAHWASLKKNALRANPKETLADLLEAFGLRNINLEAEKGSKSAGRTRRFTLQAQVIADQTICPVPAFGSKAGGHYELMIYASQASVEEIIRDAGTSGPHPRIAIVLGRLSEAQRRTFARQAHQQRRSVLLLDESLLLFLALHEGYRLAALFHAALPFSYSDPYTTTAGNIPTEIFYGRTQEIEKIRDPEGPSLVFGGRQLGKSALLQHVAKLDHAPERGHIVRVLDCRQIGRSEPTRAIWPRISNDLVTLGITDGKLTDGHQIADQIMDWLDADKRRRLLICLDEMDGFMIKEVEADYEHLVIMKELMQRSDWRCKFVFAGLHDIQRMAKTVNTPLAHLGEPICIGPLYGDDLAAAHRLVTLPMAAAGYHFESEALPLRILADVLYYPSLVQVYCKQLLAQLSEAQYSEQEGPRYTITAAMVERAFAGEQLRSQLAHRFDLTLRLDQRYRLIALILTQQAFEDRNRHVEGYSLQWIRNEALHWWPQGFPSTSNDAFRTLLDEMQGLGVLYKRNAGWRLRSTKIASMIGAPERIEQDLLEFENKQADLAYEPAIYHRGIANDPFRPSPLTQRQEYDLVDDKTGISIVFGSPLQGADHVLPAIESADPPMPVQRLGPTSDIRSFGNAIGKAESRRRATVLVVGPDQPWTMEWVRGALRHPAIRKRKVRLIFAGGSDAALEWAESGLGNEDGTKLQILPLRPWTDQGLQLWLHDINLDTLDTAEERARILSETGGFTDLVRNFGTHLHNVPRDWPQHRDSWFDEVAVEMLNHDTLGVLPRMAPLVRTLGDLGDTTIARDEVAELPELYGFDLPVSVDVALAWAETMGFLTPSGRAQWRINPLLVRLAAIAPDKVIAG